MDKGNKMKLEIAIIELKKCQDFAINKRNGLCLAIEYKNTYTKMPWQCSEGHQWEAAWNRVSLRTWCPICAKNKTKPSIKELQEFATSKNWKLLSTEYVNNKTNLLWQCEFGHQWNANWNNIKNNSGCFHCKGKIEPDIKELQKFAINKNAELISTIYINNKKSLIWQCNKCNNQWKANWNNVKNGSWCPYCYAFKTELKCKELLEQKLNIKFKKTRFYYNIKNLHKFIEFDGYNEENRIAFEYHGIQHYQFSKHWHDTKNNFEVIKRRDNLKEQYAAENNIQLIIIPYTKEKELVSYISSLVINAL
jgi:hypothetical protein